MQESKFLILFKIDDSFFALPYEEDTKIIEIEKREFTKLKDYISIKSIIKQALGIKIENVDKDQYFHILQKDNKNIIIPFKFYKKKLDEKIYDEGKNFILKNIEFKGKKVIILSIKWILKNFFEEIMEKKDIIDKNEEITSSHEEKGTQTKMETTNIDEEKKKEIFDQIEKEIDKLKISNFHEVQKKYLKGSKSFTSQLIILYSILIGLAIVVFFILNALSGQQETKLAEDIKNIGGMESLIIKELQKKQEMEKNQLQEQLNEISKQLEAIQKQKEQFEKNQIIALNAKTKEIEDEYMKKLEEEKNKLNRGLISRAEYDKRVKELLAEKDKRLQELRNQSDEQRKAFQQQMEAKENELKAKEQSYKQAISEKEKEIEKANQAMKSAQEKLALSEEAQKKMAQENEQLKQSSALQIKLRETIATYYKDILVNYRNNNVERLKKSLNDFYNFIFNNPTAAIMAEDEKLFDKFVIDVILNELNQNEDRTTKRTEKAKLLDKALAEHKKGNLIASYESYYAAFTRYDVLVDNERMYFEDFLKLVYEKQSQESTLALENAATPLYNSIVNAYQNKNYNSVIQLANNFLNQYSASKNSLAVVEYKVKAEENLLLRNQESQALNLYQKAKDYYKVDDYDNAVKTLLELFSKYGNTSYSAMGTELLQDIYIKVKQKASTVVQKTEEVYENEIKVGNVFKIFPEIIQILKDPNVSFTIEIGTQLIVKHKNDDGTFTTNALVEVTSFATTIINAKIIKIYGKGPNIGDYVFAIKK